MEKGTVHILAFDILELFSFYLVLFFYLIFNVVVYL